MVKKGDWWRRTSLSEHKRKKGISRRGWFIFYSKEGWEAFSKEPKRRTNTSIRRRGKGESCQEERGMASIMTLIQEENQGTGEGEKEKTSFNLLEKKKRQNPRHQEIQGETISLPTGRDRHLEWRRQTEERKSENRRRIKGGFAVEKLTRGRKRGERCYQIRYNKGTVRKKKTQT